jgi:hypothetical protein
MEAVMLIAVIIILSVAYLVLVYVLIHQPKVFKFDVFAHDGRWIDTVNAFTKRDVEKSFNEKVYVKKREG